MVSNIEKKTRVLSGTVKASRSDKTVVVVIVQLKRHAKYKKVMKLIKKFQVHDETNFFKGKIGEKVNFVECRPISKNKRHKVLVEDSLA
jgi:small subunit ribosomal protein S17